MCRARAAVGRSQHEASPRSNRSNQGPLHRTRCKAFRVCPPAPARHIGGVSRMGDVAIQLKTINHASLQQLRPARGSLARVQVRR